MATIKKACKGTLYPKSSSVSKRLKAGGSFPDLNKDGKITKADILVGKGVIKAKKGKKVIKGMKKGAKAMPPMMMPPSGSAPMGGGPMMKKGGKMKKAKTGAKMTKKCMYGCK